MANEYIADFETLAGDIEKTHVHTWGVMNQKTKKKEYGSSIADFIRWCDKKSKKEKTIVWFHNLKFDGSFTLDFIERELEMRFNGAKKKKSFSYTALIDGMNNYYSIEIVFKRYDKKTESVLLLDSAKRIPNMSVEDMAEAYKLPMKKGNYDYLKYRPEGHLMTEEEKEYLDNDLEIVGAVLDMQSEMGLESMTIGSCALNIYKQMMGKERFKLLFPTVTEKIDGFIRNSYNGGFVALNKKIKNKIIGEGHSIDVNSLYPYVLSTFPMPYGVPIKFSGKYREYKNYPLYIVQLKAEFELKEGHIPTVQLDMPFSLKRMKIPEFATKSDGTEPFTLTNVDLELFFEHYDVVEGSIQWLGGYMFKASTNLFKEYVDYYSDLKIQAKKEGNVGVYNTCKLLLNSLYGKFGAKMKRINKIPRFDILTDAMSYSDKVEEIKPPLYTAVASFTTAYGRAITIRASQKNYERWLYSDTDSCHFSGVEVVDNLPIHDTNLGEWKFEGTFQRAKYIRQKSYIHEKLVTLKDGTVKTELKIACSGMKESIKPQVTFENFYVGKKFDGAKKRKVIKGGSILLDYPFTV